MQHCKPIQFPVETVWQIRDTLYPNTREAEHDILGKITSADQSENLRQIHLLMQQKACYLPSIDCSSFARVIPAIKKMLSNMPRQFDNYRYSKDKLNGQISKFAAHLDRLDAKGKSVDNRSFDIELGAVQTIKSEKTKHLNTLNNKLVTQVSLALTLLKSFPNKGDPPICDPTNIPRNPSTKTKVVRFDSLKNSVREFEPEPRDVKQDRFNQDVKNRVMEMKSPIWTALKKCVGIC